MWIGKELFCPNCHCNAEEAKEEVNRLNYGTAIKMKGLRSYLHFHLHPGAGATIRTADDTRGRPAMDIQDLMNVKVTSASKKEQKLSRTAAAICVITQEDIRRSGAANISDVLRMVPGMNVARIDGSTLIRRSGYAKGTWRF
jgi:outer membrane receptor for Fe3+-dicitrate